MLINDDIEVKISSNNIEYFRKIGYDCRLGEKIKVKTSDLQNGSNKRIRYKCDKCGKIMTIQYCDYNRRHGKGKDFCGKCKYEKTKVTNKERYGCENVMGNDEIKKRLETTNIEKYGANCVFKNEDIKKKIQSTMEQRYGCKSPIQNDEIKERTIKTNIEKFGIPYPISIMSNPEKAKVTNLKKYGCEYSIASREVREKIRKSFYKNGSIRTSSQQIHICNLYGAKLNYPFDFCNVDMYFEKEKIYCEYDGGGHAISIYFGRTKEDFELKERRRAYYLESIGLKEFRIISRKDFIPSDETLLSMKDFAFHKLLNEGYNWIKFDIDNGTVEYKGVKENYSFK